MAAALAEAHACVLADFIETRLATTDDIKRASKDLKTWVFLTQVVVIGILAALIMLFG